MRLFYEAWMFLDPNSSVMTDELQAIDNHKITDSSVMNDELNANSTITINELQDYKIDIYHDVDEHEVEQQIIQNVKNFIMTFGKDFAFIGNQYHLEMYGVEHFPDLLFFNRELNALVVVELKTGDFKSSYLM